MKKIIWIILLSLSSLLVTASASAQTMTLADAKKAVKYTMGFSTSAFFPDSIITWALNEGAKQIAWNGYAVERQDTIERTAETIQYSLNDDVVKIAAVHLYQQGLADKFQALTLIELPAVGKQVLSELTYGYWYWGTELTGYKIGCYPVPEGTDTIVVFYWAQANTLSDDTTQTWIPATYHNLMVDYAIGRLWERQGRQDKAQFYFEKFWQLLGQKAYDRLLKWQHLKVAQQVIK